ncbi:hypothetical protein QBC35DRAFT_494402 [Podospora australis]|uniref:C3H1-type domain-containing protein n=1 Tax=Podospora australis TaxID=1536484 RepID=A0AAN6WVH7_9PEZI|nr:hypothetical protein QBC35DRAFT_494402 [Podospora australis]
MPTEDENREMMERIGRLAAQINRHKNQQAGFVPPSPVRSHHHTGYHTGWHRGGHPYRGYHQPSRPIHRNRTLILNGASQTPRPTDRDPGTPSDASGSSWVTKTDRHLQLINTAVYEKEAPNRTLALEQTRQQKAKLKSNKERSKLLSHLNHLRNSGGYGAANLPGKYEVSVQGIPFIVTKNGSKLVKAPGDDKAAKATPKTAIIGGVRFYRSRNGNLYRHGVVTAQRRSGTVKKVNVPCKQFSMTGSCAKGPRCRYIHDPHKVAICKDFLQGSCDNGEHCDLSHDPTPERTPACLHFARDSCTKADCKYAHVKVPTAAPVCRPFGLYGYCEKGLECSDRHVFECPDFSNTGVCKNKGCKLAHRERASVLRKASGARANEDVEMADFSSDEDGESVNSDDVDSDEVDEFIGQDDDGGFDISEQQDFIEL